LSEVFVRIFQNSSVYAGYIPRLRRISPPHLGFAEQVSGFLSDRYASSHILKPVLDESESAFFTNGNDEVLQQTWAREHGMSPRSSLSAILLSQIEDHGAEVFYNLDPIRFDDDFVRKLPGCVRLRIAWRAAPSRHENFSQYDLIVNNFPDILKRYSDRGYRTAEFFPAHDEAMDPFATNTNRPTDILFVGGFSRHHGRRTRILESVAELADRWTVRFCLDKSLLTRIVESPVGLIPPFRGMRLPSAIRRIAENGLFGMDLYEAIGGAKITLNAAVDMAGRERGNMRCFEAMGCGSLLLSDEGRYPTGMVPGENMFTYRDSEDVVGTAEALLGEGDSYIRRIAMEGHRSVRECFSRERQWQSFLELCG